MKKYILKLNLIVFATILFFSCNDEFLERYSLDSISTGSFWNTENDLMVYNNSLYNMAINGNVVPILLGHSTPQSIWYIDLLSDNLAVNDPTNAFFYLQIRTGKNIVPVNPDLYGWQPDGWSFIRSCNIGLANYDHADINQIIKDRYKGEARLFRGWFYADKVSKFGDVPWLDKELSTNSEELYGPRTPREEVMDNVLADLTFACQKLPDSWGDGNAPGRLNRWAALAVKSRVCLFEGTWRKYHGGTDATKWLTEAVNAAKELIEKGPYKLYTSGDPKYVYNAISRKTDLTGVSEVIYYRRYQEGILTHNIPRQFHSLGIGATKNMVEDYLCADGLPITLSPLYQGDEVYENIFENRDPRLRQTILHPADQPYYNYGNHAYGAYTYPRVQGMVGTVTSTGYPVIKTFDATEVYNKTYNMDEMPAIILRLAEVLLNYAEAKAELGTITQADLDMSINKLRDRVAMPHMIIGNIPVDPRYVNDGVSPLIVEIRRERRIELFMEGFRYDDLRRWKQIKKLETPGYGMRWDDANIARLDPNHKAKVFTSLVNGVPYIDVLKGTDWANPVLDESKHYLWPIPLSSISQNTNLEQTPGW